MLWGLRHTSVHTHKQLDVSSFSGEEIKTGCFPADWVEGGGGGEVINVTPFTLSSLSCKGWCNEDWRLQFSPTFLCRIKEVEMLFEGRGICADVQPDTQAAENLILLLRSGFTVSPTTWGQDLKDLQQHFFKSAVTAEESKNRFQFMFLTRGLMFGLDMNTHIQKVVLPSLPDMFNPRVCMVVCTLNSGRHQLLMDRQSLLWLENGKAQHSHCV